MENHEASEKKVETENPYIQNKTPTQKLSDLVKGEETTKGKGNNCVRVRVSYVCSQKGYTNTELAMELLERLKQFFSKLTEIDEGTKITKWEENDGLVLTKVDNLSPYVAQQYVGMPNGTNFLGKGKRKIGFRVMTDLTKEQLINKWNASRKDENYGYINEAEMQSSPKAHAIGFLQGSTPKMLTNSINGSLKNLHAGTKVEVSSQFIPYMDGLTNRAWENAKEKAENDTPNGVSKNRMKNLYAPSAIVVYVSEREKAHEVTKQLLAKYGQNVKENIWENGGQMRFIPIISKGVSENNKEKIENMFTWHIHSKATEATMDLNITDLETPKEYFGGKTLEQVILGLPSSKVEGYSIFKNIARKWTPDPMYTGYEVTTHSLLKDEAESTLLSLHTILHDKYGPDVSQHFGATDDLLISEYNRKTNEEIELDSLIGTIQIEHEVIFEPGFNSKKDEVDLGFTGGSTINISEGSHQYSTLTGETGEKDDSSIDTFFSDHTGASDATSATNNTRSERKKGKPTTPSGRNLKQLATTSMTLMNGDRRTPQP